MSTISSTNFIRAIQQFTAPTPGLKTTFGSVEAVSENGFYVDVKPLIVEYGASEVISNVPILKNKYINVPIRKDDIVVLLKINHLQQAFNEKGVFDNETTYLDSYIALPYCILTEFNASFDDNEIIQTTEKQKYRLELSEDNGLQVKDQSGQVQVDIKDEGLTIKAGQNEIKISASGELSISSVMPIEIKTSSGSLGSFLNDFLMFLQSAQTSPAAVGSPCTTIGPTSAPQLAQLISTNKLILK